MSAPNALADLSTPCLLIDDPRLHRNIVRMQEKAASNDVQLRPHTKTHKSIAIARQQAQQGAEGITVAKVGEAETFVEAGFDDVRLAYPVVGADKHERLLALMDRARISFCVDTQAGAEAAAAVYDAHDRTAEVLMEIDVGHGRCGVPCDDEAAAVHLAQHIAALPGLRLTGILTHAGQAYHGPHDDESPEKALQRASIQERDRMLHIAAALHEAEIPGATPDDFTISIGSTPSMRAFQNVTQGGFRITEIRPGNYVFFDATQVGLSAATLDDCALTVLTTVISRRDDEDGTRLYLDAGKKVTTTDTGACTTGYGILLRDPSTRTPLADATITGMSEEHGWVRTAGDTSLQVGDRVQFVPNHACVTVNTQDVMYRADPDGVREALPVDARGRVA
jgi:D-serine deaminase-like pyridoxal phosphate-dependent protein